MRVRRGRGGAAGRLGAEPGRAARHDRAARRWAPARARRRLGRILRAADRGRSRRIRPAPPQRAARPPGRRAVPARGGRAGSDRRGPGLRLRRDRSSGGRAGRRRAVARLRHRSGGRAVRAAQSGAVGRARLPRRPVPAAPRETARPGRGDRRERSLRADRRGGADARRGPRPRAARRPRRGPGRARRAAAGGCGRSGGLRRRRAGARRRRRRRLGGDRGRRPALGLSLAGLAGTGIGVAVRKLAESVTLKTVENPAHDRMARPWWRDTGGLGRRRQLAGVLLVAVLPLLTAVLLPGQGALSLSDDLLIYLVCVVGVAVVGGFWPAVAAAVTACLLLNWYFMPPVHTFTIDDPQNMLALLLFVTVAVSVSSVVHLAARRAVQ